MEEIEKKLQALSDRVALLEQGLTPEEKKELSYALHLAVDDGVTTAWRFCRVCEFLRLFAKKFGVTSEDWKKEI